MRDDGWSVKWSCEKLKHDDVSSIAASGDNQVQLVVKEIAEPVKVFTISRQKVTASDVADAAQSPDVEFVMNIPKNAVFEGAALAAAEAAHVGIGGVGDLYTAINERELRTYVPKEARFILRGLRQHSAVSRVTQGNNRSYIVERRHLDALTVLALNEYDLTAEAVRAGIEKFGAAHIILMSNPNCRPTIESMDAATQCGARLLKWGELLGALHR